MKNIISNISFARKLVALLILPAISIAFFAGKEIYHDVSQISDMNHVANLAQMAISGGNLVHVLQAVHQASDSIRESSGRLNQTAHVLSTGTEETSVQWRARQVSRRGRQNRCSTSRVS